VRVLETFILEVLGSNLSGYSASAGRFFVDFPWYHQANARIVFQLGLGHFLPNILQFTNYPVIQCYMV
jgi:hypothetical protein